MPAGLLLMCVNCIHSIRFLSYHLQQSCGKATSQAPVSSGGFPNQSTEEWVRAPLLDTIIVVAAIASQVCLDHLSHRFSALSCQIIFPSKMTRRCAATVLYPA